MWHDGAGHAAARKESPDPLELARAAQKAVALAQQEKSTWTRADLIKYLGRVLPRTGMEPAAAAALLEDLADRALRSEFEPVICLEAPEAVEVPRSLLRADGRSIYQRHGGVRYATRAQLAMEERLVAQASAGTAPRLTRADAARALGADLARLEDTLAGRAQEIQDHHPERTRADCRSVRGCAVGADRRQARLRDQRAGRIGQDAGDDRSRPGLGRGRTARRRDHALAVRPQHPGRRGDRVLQHRPVPGPPARPARSPRPARHHQGHPAAGRRVLDDPHPRPGRHGQPWPRNAAPRWSWPATPASCRPSRTAAPCPCSPTTLGYVQLPDPVRFRAAWEQAASLRLRAGDTSVLAEYDQHGRITGGEPEQMIDAAAAAYVALTLDGTDTLLMAAEHGLRRELSRRIRDDLIHLGIVDAGPAVRIADGTEASIGDLIVCTKNDHSVQAGEPGRSLANGDLLRIEAITPDGLLVRRALDADPRTGQRRWTDRNFLYADYGDCELGYAVTDHVAQSRTVHTGLAVITGTEDRQHAYVALTRGTDTNTAYVFTLSPKIADPAPGPRPAPELARYDRLTAERGGEPADAGQTAGTGDALGVLSDVLERDGQQLSAASDAAAGLVERRPPGDPARHLDSRDHPRA